jgi:DNA-binding GntR family transcriptional regulator
MIGPDLDHHAEMLDALQRGDGARARRALAADIGDAADVMLRSLNAPAVPRRAPARMVVT